MKLAINRCPVHRDYMSISIDDENGGTRVTPDKCCGQWRTIRDWSLPAYLWESLIKEARGALRVAKKLEKERTL
jgi:hypothetical protein